MLITEAPATLMKPAKAHAVVASMADVEWTYRVRVFPTGWAVVDVYDEDGEYVGTL